MPKGMKVEIYMSSYILDAICAQQEFLGLRWNWSPTETVINTYCKLLSECSFRGVITQLSDHFVTLFYKMIFKQDPPCMSKATMEALMDIIDWYASPSNTFIRMYSCGEASTCSTKFFLRHTRHAGSSISHLGRIDS